MSLETPTQTKLPDAARLLRELDRLGGHSPVLARAPGRVNLIGEHTDYNDGFVLPMALDREVRVGLARREDGLFVASSLDLAQELRFSMANLALDPAHGWANYAKAVVAQFTEEGYGLPGGLSLVVSGNIPQGGGLSSSAAFELAVARALAGMTSRSWDAVAMARLGQRAENRFIGVQCGIMDQMAVAGGEAGSALFLDCRSLRSEAVPVNFADAQFVVVHSGVTRGLKGSEYNQRRADCEGAVVALKGVVLGAKALRDINVADLAKHGALLSPSQRMRSEHVVRENLRVLKACVFLRKGDAVSFGALMTESHASLRDLYQVSCPELDALVEIGNALEGVYGSRLTGAGFGGCSVHLVRRDRVPAFGAELSRRYRERCDLGAVIIPCLPAAPASLVEHV